MSVLAGGRLAVDPAGSAVAAGAVGADPAPVPAPERRPWAGDPADALARAVIAGLFLGLAYRIGQNFLETGRPTGLLLLASELLVVVLTLVRRPARYVDRGLTTRAFATISILGPPLLRPTGDQGLAPESVTLAVSVFGLLIVIAGKLSLGRSFGLMPAHRGIVVSGLYRLVRHPIYLGYVITHAAFLAAHPTVWNTAMLVGADVALLVRACYEERALSHDPAYASYCQRVRWRLVPGVF